MRTLRILLAAALLNGCASAASLQFRDSMRDHCKEGDQFACNILPSAQAQVDQEASDSGKQIAGAILVGLVAGAAASSYNSYGYSRPDVIIVRSRPCRFC